MKQSEKMKRQKTKSQKIMEDLEDVVAKSLDHRKPWIDMATGIDTFVKELKKRGYTHPEALSLVKTMLRGL